MRTQFTKPGKLFNVLCGTFQMAHLLIIIYYSIFIIYYLLFIFYNLIFAIH